MRNEWVAAASSVLVFFWVTRFKGWHYYWHNKLLIMILGNGRRLKIDIWFHVPQSHRMRPYLLLLVNLTHSTCSAPTILLLHLLLLLPFHLLQYKIYECFRSLRFVIFIDFRCLSASVLFFVLNCSDSVEESQYFIAPPKINRWKMKEGGVGERDGEVEGEEDKTKAATAAREIHYSMW